MGIENDLHYGSLQKESTPKSVAMTESLDMYVEGVSSKKSSRGSNSKIECEEGVRRSSPIMALPAGIDSIPTGGARVKIEREHNNEGTGNTRISPDLTAVLKRAAGIEDMELGSVDNSAVQGESFVIHVPQSLYSCVCFFMATYGAIVCFGSHTIQIHGVSISAGSYHQDLGGLHQ